MFVNFCLPSEATPLRQLCHFKYFDLCRFGLSGGVVAWFSIIFRMSAQTLNDLG